MIKYIIILLIAFTPLLGKSQTNLLFNNIGNLKFNEDLPLEKMEEANISYSKFKIQEFYGYFLCNNGMEIRKINLFSHETEDSLQFDQPVIDFFIENKQMYLLSSTGVSVLTIATKEISPLGELRMDDWRTAYETITKFSNQISLYNPITDSSLTYSLNKKTVSFNKGKMIKENTFVSCWMNQNKNLVIAVKDGFDHLTENEFKVPFSIGSCYPLGIWNDQLLIYVEHEKAGEKLRKAVLNVNNNTLQELNLDPILNTQGQTFLDFSDDIDLTNNNLYMIKVNSQFITIYNLEKRDLLYSDRLAYRFKNQEDSISGLEKGSFAFKSALRSFFTFNFNHYKIGADTNAMIHNFALNFKKFDDYFVSSTLSKSVATTFSDVLGAKINSVVITDPGEFKNLDLVFKEYGTLSSSELEQRKKVLTKAYAFLNVDWEINDDVAKNILSINNTLVDGKTIRVPFSKKGKYSFMPYGWGCNDNIQEFKDKIYNRGCVPGDIDCNRDKGGRPNKVAGVDCSGFVSVCYQMKRRGTSQLPEVSTSYTSTTGDDSAPYSKLKPGDILNKAGHHVMIFVARLPSQRFVIIQSSTVALGVNFNTYDLSYVKTFLPRYIIH